MTHMVEKRYSYISEIAPYKKWEITKENGKFYYLYYERGEQDLEKWNQKTRREISADFFREKYSDFRELEKFGMGILQKSVGSVAKTKNRKHKPKPKTKRKNLVKVRHRKPSKIFDPWAVAMRGPEWAKKMISQKETPKTKPKKRKKRQKNHSERTGLTMRSLKHVKGVKVFVFPDDVWKVRKPRRKRKKK